MDSETKGLRQHRLREAEPEAGHLHVVTAVEFHGRRGRFYFIPVRFLHDQVLGSMMTRAVEFEITP